MWTGLKAMVSTFSARPVYGPYFGSQKNRNRNLDVCSKNRSKSIVLSKVHIAPTLYKCNSTDRKIKNCPYVNGNNFMLCTWCKAYHAINAPCYAKAPGKYRAEVENEGPVEAGYSQQSNYDGQYIIAIIMNGYALYATRDTGCDLTAFVQPKFVNSGDYTGQFLHCRGVFDNPDVWHNVPLANV